ncbi:hypothetical protein [Chroococcus sp. FPU101]|uniref:hypothetical protein n=1 Tax=Chroococcus sp. FPU101 TaxID=1974212 RepID=UPI001A8E0100|nr:hypothetical protein [Chroococcus sp. FPU101]GFE72210.1 hypothetical protein CFPU101_48200 [Chroococcus sp. FPU101]
MTLNITRVDTPNGRFYQTPSGLLPSVNLILDATTPEADRLKFEKWRSQHPNSYPARRGTLLHEAIAYLINTGQPPISLDPEIQPYWNSILPWLKIAGQTTSIIYPNTSERVAAVELAVYEPRLGYAGTLDWVGEWNKGTIALVDFKSSHRHQRREWLTRYRLQCAAYQLAFEFLFNIEISKIVIPIALPGRIAQVFEFHSEDMKQGQAQWLERLDQYQQIVREEKLLC